MARPHTSTPTRRFHPVEVVACVLLALCIGAVVGLFFPVRTQFTWVDAVSGSMKYETRLLGMFSVHRETRPSALERWIVRHEGRHVRRWQFLSEVRLNLYGQPVARGCRISPEAYVFHGQIGEDLVPQLSDAQLANLVKILRAGNADEQRIAVQDACDSAFRSSDHRGAESAHIKTQGRE